MLVDAGEGGLLVILDSAVPADANVTVDGGWLVAVREFGDVTNATAASAMPHKQRMARAVGRDTKLPWGSFS